jgi:hypothetical protein
MLTIQTKRKREGRETVRVAYGATNELSSSEPGLAQVRLIKI